MAKSEMASPVQVALETFLRTDGGSGVRAKDAPTLFVCMVTVKMLRHAFGFKKRRAVAPYQRHFPVLVVS